MATRRVALRELQTRLASRLQAARTEGVSIAWLAVTSGPGHYLFPLVQSGEIFSLGQIQPVPYCKNWFLGVVNLRGGLFGVVDFATFAAKGQKPQRSEQALSEASVVTFHTALEVNCALMVDSLAGLRNPEAFTSAQAAAADAPSFFGNRYIDASGIVWQEVNLQSLAQLPEFLSISAQS